jgi:hypothetical protein
MRAIVDVSLEEDSPMAKSPKSKGKAKAKKAVPEQAFGKLNKDGTAKIDFKSLERFKRTLGTARFAKVRFVARNAPFKRRSAIPPG